MMDTIVEYPWRSSNTESFNDLIDKQSKPLLLKGLALDWPVTQAAMQSSPDLFEYLDRMYNGKPVESFRAPAETEGRYFYSADLKGFNFERSRTTLPNIFTFLNSVVNHTASSFEYVGSTPVDFCLPGFSAGNKNPLLPDQVTPNFWLGNQSRIAPHIDLSHNIACVVAGTRTFTLFPPEQIENLYIGPLDITPAGQPISLVDISKPDLVKFPRFEIARTQSLEINLEPGDAVYIPPLWWHAVEAKSDVNFLVNYWWNPDGAQVGSPYESLVHALLTIRSLSPAHRKAWKTFFDYYIFDEREKSVAHLSPDQQGALGSMTPQLADYIHKFLINTMKR